MIIELNRKFIFILFCINITLMFQGIFGTKTIYHASLEKKRLKIHHIIVNKEKPKSTYYINFMERNPIYQRVLIPAVINILHKITKVKILKLYYYLDSIFLFLILITLFDYLNLYFKNIFSFIGLLYFCLIIPLTYYDHIFHPWDRAHLFLWILILKFIKEDRFYLLLLMIILNVLIKFDSLIVPSLYYLTNLKSKNRLNVTSKTILLLISSFGTYFAIRQFVFMGNENINIFSPFKGLSYNIKDFFRHGLVFPPLLSFILPGILTYKSWKKSDAFNRFCIIHSLIFATILAFFTNFKEVRAQLVCLVLILPSSLYGLLEILTLKEGQENEYVRNEYEPQAYSTSPN